MFSHKALLLLCASALLCAAPLGAQTGQARLTGTVVDTSGAVVPNAAVTVTNERTSEVRKVAANEQGIYFVTNLPPASYRISGAAAGLGPTDYTNVALSASQERTLNLILQPSTMTQEVTVSGGELAVIDTSSATVGANVNEREVANLPLNGRQLSQLYLMAPGAQTAGGGSYDNIRFSGRANQQNAVRVDGIENSSIIDASPGNLNGETSTGFRLQNSLENVQEFRVESSNYPAEYGTGTAGQITVVTKSGGNQFHGGLFEYVRNSAFDARNFFDRERVSPLRLNQFGGSVGGPVVREKLFFFAAVEALRQRGYQNIIEAVPSAAARAVPSIRPLLDAYPSGQPTSNPDLDLAQHLASAPMNETFGSMRLDYRVSPKYTLSLRYGRDEGELIQPLNVTRNVARTRATPQNAMVSLQQILSPTVINETKFGFNGSKTRYNGVVPSVNGLGLSEVSIDFTGTVAIAGIGGQGVSGGAARIGGLLRSNSSQNGRAQPYTNYTLSFVDNLNWVQGNHNRKFGFEVRPIRMYTDRQGGTTYTFANVNALINNQPSAVTVLGDISAPNPLHGGATGNRFLKQYYLIGYAQDEWKLRPNLTLNYGLRYEYYSVLREDRNLFTFFDMSTGKLDSNPNRPWYNSSKLNFGPRLALTWAPAALKNRTVLRIGSGYYYGPGQTEDQVQPIDSDRVSVTAPAGSVFPVNAQALINNFDVNNLRNFQPRVYAPGYTLPERVLSYTASLQQTLPGDAVLTTAYVASQGRNLFLRSWTNVILGVAQNGNSISPVRQYGSAFEQMDYKTSGGTDRYDSLQTTVNRRFKQGLTVGGQWTWSHSIGNTGGSNEAQTAQNPFNFEQDRGNNAFDVRHSMNATVLYELPFGKGRKYGANLNRMAGLALGGWELGGVLNARTGLPIDLTIARQDLTCQLATGQYVNPSSGACPAGATGKVNNPYGGAFRNNRRPNVVAGVSPYLTNPADRRVFLNPAAFAYPEPGTFGNLGRWALHGPSLAQFDLTLHKRFTVTERWNFEFRAEVYNVLNRANFANPVSRLNDSLGTGTNQLQPNQPYTQAAAGSTFGLATSTVTRDVGLGTGRQMQLSLRLNF